MALAYKTVQQNDIGKLIGVIKGRHVTLKYFSTFIKVCKIVNCFYLVLTFLQL